MTTTAAIRIDGKAKAAELSKAITAESEALLREHGVRPGLAVVIVGEDPASQVYVRNKQRTEEACGFHSVRHALAEDVAEAELLALSIEVSTLREQLKAKDDLIARLQCQ